MSATEKGSIGVGGLGEVEILRRLYRHAVSALERLARAPACPEKPTEEIDAVGLDQPTRKMPGGVVAEVRRMEFEIVDRSGYAENEPRSAEGLRSALIPKWRRSGEGVDHRMHELMLDREEVGIDGSPVVATEDNLVTPPQLGERGWIVPQININRFSNPGPQRRPRQLPSMVRTGQTSARASADASRVAAAGARRNQSSGSTSSSSITTRAPRASRTMSTRP